MGSMSAAPIDRKVRGVLSPSRAGDFMSCPLLFRYRTIDRLPEGSSPDAVRGTLVHQVLEEIFDLPAAERTPAAAHRLLEPAWRPLQQRSRQAREVAATLDEPAWLDSAHDRARPLVHRWRTRPGSSRPSARSSSRPPSTRGCRCAASSTGSTRRPTAPCESSTTRPGQRVAEGFEFKALFQLRIYALILWRSRGVVPRMLQLVYLGTTSEMVRYEPDEADLLATERKVDALWEAIELAKATGEFLPSRGKQCDWCAFKAHCPAWGGELLPMPAPPSRWARLKRAVRRRWRRVAAHGCGAPAA